MALGLQSGWPAGRSGGTRFWFHIVIYQPRCFCWNRDPHPRQVYIKIDHVFGRPAFQPLRSTDASSSQTWLSFICNIPAQTRTHQENKTTQQKNKHWPHLTLTSRTTPSPQIRHTHSTSRTLALCYFWQQCILQETHGQQRKDDRATRGQHNQQLQTRRGGRS